LIEPLCFLTATSGGARCGLPWADFSATDDRIGGGGGVSGITRARRTAPVGFFETGTGRRDGVLAFLGTTRTGGLPPSIRGASAEDVEEEGVEGVASMRLMVGSRFAGV